MRDDIFLKLKSLICECSKFEVDPTQIKDETNLIEELQFDSISLIELISKVEESYCVDFNYSDLDLDVISVYKGLESTLEQYLK